jgi:HD-like signal output (HDOD) protein
VPVNLKRPMTAEALASELWRLPPLPGALARLLEVAHDERAGMGDVTAAVALDEVLSTHVLRAANSALLGFRAPATTIQQAVARIGCGTVLSVAVAQALSDTAPLATSVGGVPRVAHWQHNWAVATAAAFLGPMVNIRRGEAHLAGLLHDMGRLLLASRDPWVYEECVTQAKVDSVPLHHVEARLLGLDHAAAGACALASWKMPELVILAAAGHHDEMPGGATPIASLVSVADKLAHHSGLGDSGNPAWLSPFGHPELHPRIPETALGNCLQHLERESRWLCELAARFAEG